MAATTPFKRDFPFLHRAWKTAVGHLSPYAPERIFTTANGDHASTAIEDDAGRRAAKRRRLTPDSSESAFGEAVSRILPDDPCDFEKALRIEILKITQQGGPGFNPEIFHKSTGSPVKKDAPLIKCRCKLMIYRMSRPGEIRILYCDSQLCSIKVLEDANSARRMARVYLAQPFHIPAEKIYVLRDDDGMFTLDDSYYIQVELESAGDPRWPPLNLLPADQRDASPESARHWALSAQTHYTFDKHRTAAPVKVRKQPGAEDPLGLDMDIDLRWSANHALPPNRPPIAISPPEAKGTTTSGALEPLTGGQLNQSAETLGAGRFGDSHEILGDDEDDAEEAVTPTRALRQKKKQVYNLKALSDKARGKGQKERKRQAKAAEAAIEDGQVTWLLPESAPVNTSEFMCVRCFASHVSMAQLQQHVEDHREFKCRFDLSPKYGLRVLISMPGQATPDPDDLESESAREATPKKQTKPRPVPRKPVQQRLPPAKPKDPRQLIPDNKQPLYNRVSKSTLTPGTFVEPPPVDDSWLMQKHRDVILDYSDVHAGEKEYICEWDAFVLKQRVTSEPHLQEVYLSFVEDKATWLTSRQSRMTEFAKHLTYLKARNALTQETIVKAFAMLKEAKVYSQEEPVEISEESKPTSPRVEGRKSASGCGVCGQPVRGPSTLICDNDDCDRPFYHDDCIRPHAKTPVDSRKWRCNDCHKDEMVVD